MDIEDIGTCPSDLALAGKARGCQGCPGQALCQTQVGPDPKQATLNIRMKAIKHKILVMSGKGGVGKSTVAAALAAWLARRGPVAVLDADICGPSLPQLLAVEGIDVTNTQWGWKPPVSPIGNIKVLSVGSMLPSADSAVTFRGPRKTGLLRSMLADTLWGRLNYLVIDTPPGTSDEHLSVVKLLQEARPDGVVIVTTPQQLVCDVVRRQITFCRKVGLKILGLVLNMSQFVCPCCQVMGGNGWQERTEVLGGDGAGRLCAELGLPLLGSVPLDPALAASCDAGLEFGAKFPDSAAAAALEGVAGEVARLCEHR